MLVLGVTVIAAFAALQSALATPKTSASALFVALETQPRSVDPRFVGTDANSQYLEPLLFLPLIGFSEFGVPQEILAETVKVLDPLTVVVKIRDGVRFNNGREVDAQDVAATYSFIRKGLPGLPPSPRRETFERIKAVEGISKREVRISLSEPDAALVSNLVVGILPREALSRAANDLIGQGFESGPFVLAKAKDDEWILQRNEKYTGAPFGGELPALEKVIFKIFIDNDTRSAALLKGEVDLIQNNLDTGKVVEFKNKRSGDFDVQLRTADSTAFLAFNLKNKTFQDVRVRRAIALAMNRVEILKFTLQGLGQEANSMFPPGNPFYYENKFPVEFNLREAETLLDAAGLKDPDGSSGSKPRASFSIKVPLNRERIAVAKAIAGQLKKVGFKVSVEVLPFNTFMKHLNDGNVQAWIAPWAGYKDGDHLHFVFHSKRIPPFGANRGFYSNDKLDELLDKAKVETVFETRHSLYQKAQSLIATDMPYIFLWHRTGHAIVNKKFSGFRIYPDGRYTSLTKINQK